MFLANKLNKGAGTPVVLDAQFNYVTMLLHGDGTNGAQNNTFLDSSTNNFTITRNGNTTQGSFSPYGSNWSNAFDGTSDYIETPSSSAFAFGTGAYTIEGWIFINVMPSSGNIYQVFNFTDDKENLSINSSGTLNYYNGTTGTSSTATVSVGTWTHIAYTRSSTTIKAYINNTEVISASSSGNYTSNRIFVIGARAAATKGANCLNGYLSNVRVLKGTALTTFDLTTNLTAITNTVLLTCQSNRFVDNSSSPLTLTAAGNTSVQRFNPFGASTAYSTSVIGGSGYFDGSGDYLTAANTTALDLPADFTVEFWVYLNSTSDQSFVGKWSRPSGVDQFAWIVQLNSSNLRFFSGNSGAIGTGSTFSWSPVTGTWYYIAITRSGSSLRAFINGIQVGSTVTETNNLSSTSSTSIGINLDGNIQPTNGYISSVRVVKGTALYTTTFTPPTAPLTAVTNTQLLTNFTNGAIIDNAMMNDLETVGNAQISTSVVKYGTGSLAFDGTGDWLVVGNPSTRPILDFGSGDFTIEAWVYPNGTSPYLVVGSLDNSSGIGCWWLVVNGTFGGGGTIQFAYNTTAGGSGTNILAGSGTLSTSTWSHVAVTRSGSSIRCFVNGTQVGTTNTGIGTSAIFAVNQNILVGETVAGPSYGMNGYIDDLRITKGYARYTANFTAPTAALPDIGPN